ncbi:lysophospholipid acyltransferase family protein [Desulfovibrio psychrotolerans]|uniref:1-acyl-sn-glycerol-3-phosphate acyltransferase n=1 Tax=Desulfovibrio psychrotolerans TaxID=415242 RepID=A0A7J0BUH7_9BACT|nr:lysophospholipid acyltransferase family protein [Desulfovibrio psychrotolerans]GFM36654.1 1-acyl-sn-glycerol-3-phosphate acyltransferase [Desulfovibrio psychrotolerans]
MIRTLWFYLSFLTATFLLSLATLAVGAFAPAGPLCARIAALWSRSAIVLSGIRLEADIAAVPPPGKGPVVFMVNHQSQFDIPIATLLLRERYPAFVAKKSLFDIPFVGWAFRLGKHIPIDRKNSRKAMKSMENAAATAKAGRSIVIFPEGTRQKDTSQLGEFKTGGIILALKAGLPVVPVVLEGTGDILPKGHVTLKRRHTVRVRALPPIDSSSYDIKERNRFRDELHALMNTAYMEMRECRTSQTS